MLLGNYDKLTVRMGNISTGSFIGNKSAKAANFLVVYFFPLLDIPDMCLCVCAGEGVGVCKICHNRFQINYEYKGHK